MKPGFRTILFVFLGTVTVYPLILGSAVFAVEDKKAETITFKNDNIVVDRAIKADDEKDKINQQPCKVFTVDLKSGRNYTIDMVSKEIDSYLRLEDPTGKELAKDDDSGGFVNARINFCCRADGTYRVICTTFLGGTGNFTLTIKEIVLAKPKELNLKDGTAKVEAKLAGIDQTDAVQTHSVCKIYAIKLAKGKSYQIDMVSKDLDPFLRLEDSAGKELAKDDDSGGDRNARIQFQCPENGEYRIIAMTYFGGVGNFTLSVKEK